MTTEVSITRALQRIPYGLYVVGSLRDGVPASMIANWVTQVSFHPPAVAIAVEADSNMRRCIETSGVFSVNLLRPGSTGIAKVFLKSPMAVDGAIGGQAFVPARNGTPFLSEAGASMECRVLTSVPAGDHIVFLGEVVDAIIRTDEENVLTLRETGWHYTK